MSLRGIQNKKFIVKDKDLLKSPSIVINNQNESDLFSSTSENNIDESYDEFTAMQNRNKGMSKNYHNKPKI